MKHEWRKKEKGIYLPKSEPTIIDVPEYQFISIKGVGSPESEYFSECIGALYSIAYTIKMNLKKYEIKPQGYYDYTVYPLEGVWDINEDAKKTFSGTINKEDFVYTLMIRQPDFIDEKMFKTMLKLAKHKKPNALFEHVKFESIREGKCIQMLHIGSFNTEEKSFTIMENFAKDNNLQRHSKVHKEIYLSDFRKVASDKLKTVLRFKVNL